MGYYAEVILLSPSCVVDLMEVFVRVRGKSRQVKNVSGRVFKDCRPSMAWVKAILLLHSERVDTVRRQALESTQHKAMNQSTVAVQISRLIMA